MTAPKNWHEWTTAYCAATTPEELAELEVLAESLHSIAENEAHMLESVVAKIRDRLREMTSEVES